MDIYAKEGTIVKFINEGGYACERESACAVLDTDMEYVVEYIDVGGWSSDVYLKGFSQGFNTVMFEEVKK